MNTLTITTKVRIYPTPEQEQILKQSQQAYVNGCNLVSPWIKENKELTQKKINKALYLSLIHI